MNAKCLHVNEVTACKKLISCTKTMELRDTDNSVYDKTQMGKGNEENSTKVKELYRGR